MSFALGVIKCYSRKVGFPLLMKNENQFKVTRPKTNSDLLMKLGLQPGVCMKWSEVFLRI